MWKVIIEIDTASVDDVIATAAKAVGVSSPQHQVTGASWKFEIDGTEYADAVAEAMRRVNAELGGADQVEALLNGDELVVRVQRTG